MVSFQCDGCQDVVKKPKLDTHGFKCHASFTCIDCSKTFAGPAQWKGHTSCISEEQKYQKSVYQGPRVSIEDASAVNKVTHHKGRGRGRGKRGARANGRGGSARAPYAGSGENATPLGAQPNAWTAPPPDPVNNTPFDSSEWNANAGTDGTAGKQSNSMETEDASKPEKRAKISKKRKADETVIAEIAPVPPLTEEPVKKKKRAEGQVPDITPAVLDQSETEKDKDKKGKKDKKSKSQKSELKNGAPDDPETTIVNAVTEPTAHKEKKSKKKQRSDGSGASIINGDPPVIPNGGTCLVSAPPPAVQGAHPSVDGLLPKKRKSSKAKETLEAQPEEPESVATDPSTNGVIGVKRDKQDKKGKKSKDSMNGKHNAPTLPSAGLEEPQIEVGVDLIPISTIENTSQKKSKESKKEKKSKSTALTSNGDFVQDPKTSSVRASADQFEAPEAKSKKAKKRKPQSEGANGTDLASAKEDQGKDTPETMLDSISTREEKGKQRKKSKRRDKEQAMNVS